VVPLQLADILTMTRVWNGLLCRQVMVLLLCTIYDTYGIIEYEVVEGNDGQMNWTVAALQYSRDNGPFAKISNMDELCDAQTASGLKTDQYYWTALRRDNKGNYHWGLNRSATLVEPAQLLDETQPGLCYAISKSAMKLKSRNCSIAQGVLLEHIDDQEDSNSSLPYSHQCRQYKISKCLQDNIDYLRSKSLPHLWSCKEVTGIKIGNCQVERTGIDCCHKYCNSGNQTYFKDIRSDLSIKVRKVPKGFPRDVEIGFNTSDRIKLTFKLFNDTERVIVVTLQRIRDSKPSWKPSNNDTLLSDVIGVELSPPYQKMIPNLVIITFSHAKIPQGDVKRKCVFWEEDVRTSNGTWSPEGCSLLEESSRERTVCSCNHLTNFAVLMQFTPTQISKEHQVSLSIITYIGCALSLTGEALLVFVYVVFMKFKAEGIQIRINLATALFFAQVVFLSGINATSNRPACVLVAVLLHYFYLASFGWMMLEGVFLYIMIVEVFSTVNLRCMYLFAWGYPIIPVIISLVVASQKDGILQDYTNQNFCWLSFSKHLSWSFIVPVLLITVINVVILMAVLREIRNLQEPNPSTLKTVKKGLKACIILSPLLGLTWVFGLLAVMDAGLVFQYIFTILNSAQGMLIFLLHVVRNSDVRAAFHHKLLKWRFDRFSHISSANRVHEEALQSTSRRKWQNDPEDSKNEL